MIQSVNSNTSLTLDKNFAENTVTNSTYRILLNTAAHFPSDTAAKVERALEQLSDINDAAINNNRTVTAATYLNGKGLTSTAGTINLNPASASSNTGGSINFHYNQNSSTTSSIYEDASGRIKLQGNVNVTGSFNGGLKETHTGITRGANTSGTTTNALLIEYDSNSNINSQISRSFRYISANDYANFIGIQVFNPTNTTASSVGQLGIGYKNGEVYTNAPTPATSDNSTNIATTAFVNNRLPYTTGTWTPVLAGQTTAGTFTYSTIRAKYIKIGQLVYLSWYIICSIDITQTLPSGAVIITGLPFVADNKGHALNAGYSYSKFINFMTISEGASSMRFNVYSERPTTSSSSYNAISWGNTANAITWVPSSIVDFASFGNIVYSTNS